MKKSKCETMSKAQKAAERYIFKDDAADRLFQFVGEFYNDEIEDVRIKDFIKGAEALLRYAKKQKVCYSASNPKNMRTPIVVSIELLEEWVKGEK